MSEVPSPLTLHLARSEDVTSLTSPRAHCLRICSHILRNSTSSSSRTAVISMRSFSPFRCWLLKTVPEGSIPDRIGLINAAVTAFSTVANAITDSQREDIRGVAFLLYAGSCISHSRYITPRVTFSHSQKCSRTNRLRSITLDQLYLH